MPWSFLPNSNFVGYVGGTETGNVSVTNNSQVSVAINGIQTAAPFSQTNTCPSSLGAGASCQITVSWDQAEPGSSSGTLQVSYTGSGSPQSITLTGSAQSLVEFSPSDH